MATPQELLRKLDERFILGEICDEEYRQIRARLEAQAAAVQDGAAKAVAAQADTADGGAVGDTPATAGGMSVADSVIKGNVTSGSASVGNINIHVGGQGRGGGGGGAADAELDYERFVLVILRSGGNLDVARTDLDGRREELGLSLRLARDIEQACLACHRRPAAAPRPGGPPQPDPVTRFFKSLKDSISPTFTPAAPQGQQNLPAQRGAQLQPPGIQPSPPRVPGPPPAPPAGVARPPLPPPHVGPGGPGMPVSHGSGGGPVGSRVPPPVPVGMTAGPQRSRGPHGPPGPPRNGPGVAPPGGRAPPPLPTGSLAPLELPDVATDGMSEGEVGGGPRPTGNAGTGVAPHTDR